MKLLYQNHIFFQSKLTANKIVRLTFVAKKTHLQFSKALMVLSPAVFWHQTAAPRNQVPQNNVISFKIIFEIVRFGGIFKSQKKSGFDSIWCVST